MHRTNTPADVAATGTIQIDAGEGVTFSIPVGGVDLGTIAFDTGLLNINDLAPTRTAGDIYLRRAGVIVFVQCTGLKTSDQGAGSSITATTLPTGFRPALNIWDPTPLHVSESEPQYDANSKLVVPRTSVGTNGAIRFFGSDPAQGIYYSATFMTSNPLPASLPGIAA